MRIILPILLIILFCSSAIAEPVNDAKSSSTLNFVLSLNPLILIVAGIVLFFAANLAKYIGIILVIIGVASLAISFL